MSYISNLRESIHSVIKDRKIIFLIIASFLITFSTFAYYQLRIYPISIIKSLIVGSTYSFSWVIIAWLITDKSTLRKTLPYLSIFFLLLADKIFWSVFYYFYPPVTFQEIVTSGSFNRAENYEAIFDMAYYFSIILMFLVYISVFLIFWKLSKPKEFKEKLSFIKKKNMFYVILATIFITMPHWIFRVIYFFSGRDFIMHLYESTLISSLFYFTIGAIPFIIALVIFSVIITNIKSSKKYILYGLIMVFTFIYQIPLYNFGLWKFYDNIFLRTSYFAFYFVCYFAIYLSFLFLSKPKYIEQ